MHELITNQRKKHNFIENFLDDIPNPSKLYKMGLHD